MDKKMQQAALLELIERSKAGVREVGGLLSRFENEAEEAKKLVGEGVMRKKLSELAEEGGQPKACPICKKSARVRKKAVPRTFKTLSGSHTVTRNQHYCANCRETFYPRDEELGLPKFGEASVELDRRIADLILMCPQEEAEQHWNLHYPHCKLSANQFRQTSKRLGDMVEQADSHLLQTALSAPEQTPSQTTYFMSDGSMLLLREEEEKLEELLGAGWREMKLGMTFRHENHLGEPDVSRGVVTHARYVGDFNQEQFKKLLKAAVDIESSSGTAQVVYLADGAPENWAVANDVHPGATQILDWYHAVENAMKCGRALLGETNAGALEFWKKGAECLLAQGQVELLVKTLMEMLEGCKEGELEALNDFVRYLRNNQTRMNYPGYRDRGLLIGSGPIESAQRHVIQVRMKRSGQRWGQKGARQMARLRTALKTSGPEAFYRSIHWAYRETIRNRSALKKIAVARKPPKRRASNR